MRKFWLFLWTLFSTSCLAATYTVSGFTGAAIQTTMNTASAAGANNTVYLPAGTYVISSAITVPCGNNLTITGPTATPATAILSASTTGFNIFNLYSCNGITIQYLDFKNTGGMYFGNTNHSNITIQYNQFNNLPSVLNINCTNPSTQNPLTGCSDCPGTWCAAIWMDGTVNSIVTNFVAEYNTFGDSSSCTASMSLAVDTGGNCAGIHAEPGEAINHTVEYNYFNHVNEGVHYTNHAGSNTPAGALQSVTQNLQIRYNYFNNWHRIAVELQAGLINVGQNVSDNMFTNAVNPTFGTMNISDACCTGGRVYLQSAPPNPANQSNDNVFYHDASHVQIVGSFYAPVIGIEYWGGPGTTANNNVFGGAAQGWSNYINYGYNDGTSTYFAQNNYMCNAANGAYITQEFTGYPAPTQSGNVISSTCTQQTSVAPTISPASGTVTFPQTVTITNTGTNTSSYYTTDGTSPTPGSGTTQLYTGPFTLSGPATVRAVGMWGVPPQPAVHEAPFGYKPSGVISATYSGTGTVTLSSIAVSSPSGVISVATGGATVQLLATGTYSNASTQNISSTVTWASSNSSVGTINSSGLFTSGSTAGTTTITASLSGVTSPGFTITTTTTAVPTVVSCGVSQVSNINTIPVGGTIQFTASVHYSDGTNGTLPDSYGNTVTSWYLTNTTVATISTGGLYTATATGSSQVHFTNSAGIGCSSWNVTNTAATPTLVSIALSSTNNITSLNSGSTNQFSATGTYSNGTTAALTPTGWMSSNSSVATVSSSGLVTGAAVGTTNITAVYSGITSAPFALSVIAPPPILQSIVISNGPGANTLLIGRTLNWSAECYYSDGTNTNCTTVDSQGNVATWTSGNNTLATFSGNILTALALGTSYVYASAGTSPVINSPQTTMTYLPLSSLVFDITGTNVVITGTNIVVSYK